MSLLIDRPPRSEAATRLRRPSRLLAAAGAGSMAAAVAGAAYLTGDSNPFLPADSALARAVLGGVAVTWLLVAAAVIGLLAAVLSWARPHSGALRPALRAVAAAEVLTLGVALQSVTTIALAGYLFAMALPFGLIWLAVQSVRRYRRLRWPVLGALGTAGVWGAATGTLAPAHVVALARELAGGFASHGGQLLLAVLLAALTGCWALLLIALVRSTPAVRRLGAWVDAHRWGITLLAAAGPLPYALIRASWLTPWPLLVPDTEALSPEIRLWGLLLGGGALAGTVLTLGLLRPWGRTFPRWMPRWAGRPVPTPAATVPGGLVAGVVSASALPMLRTILFPEPGTVFGGGALPERLAAAMIFPFWFWGPALALAVWGYARSRHTAPPSGPERS